MSTDYPFTAPDWRAQCLRVVDGDTIDCLLDTGFHSYRRERFRLARINTAELTSKVDSERTLAQQAKDQVTQWLQPSPAGTGDVWAVRLRTQRNPDLYGRWLAEVFYRDANGVEHNVNDDLLTLQLARLYK